jgi:hydroxymethylpyrimidine/phosphomethylpyrimidine kinase
LTTFALTIGGSDCSAGAGIQADLKTLTRLGVYGLTAVTSVTAQDSGGIRHRYDLPPETVVAQVEAALAAADCRAVKIGMLGSPEIALAVFQTLRRHGPRPIVLDPVIEAEAGGSLADGDMPQLIAAELLGSTALVTPNRAEACALTGLAVESVAEAEAAAVCLCEMGAAAALITGLEAGETVTDVLRDDQGLIFYSSERLPLTAHGTGCTLSTAVMGLMAMGLPLREAIETARSFVYDAIKESICLETGWRVANRSVR